MAMQRYNPQLIERKWQEIWDKTGLYKTPDDPGNDKYYCLVMFPYPSGNLHIGHWYNFAPADTVARFHRAIGKKVLHPIGFDAFGLPAENAAIKRDIHPAQWTEANIKHMTKQLKSIGAMYDWNKVVDTSKPDYYRWTQWLFLLLYKNGLAYKKKGVVNWCPKDKTVLANEQVVGERNECERCGTPVVQKELEQWYFKITAYAERLLKDAQDLDWPERVKTMQANWIGRSRGAEIDFLLDSGKDKIKVFTTRPDTLFGATFLVLAPEHALVKKLLRTKASSELKQYVDQARRKTELERKQEGKAKTGVFSGAYAVNPLSREKMPIWVADYVLMSYGTGAIMAVPAHDHRDYEFAKRYNLPIKTVIESQAAEKGGAYPGEGRLVNSGKYSGLDSAVARERITADLVKQRLGKEKVNYKLRDWLVSRQRYWGAPIPIIYCKACGTVPVPEEDLPVKLPRNIKFHPSGRSPLADNESFINTKCPTCGRPAKRETDTLDTFVDSSWYYLRYPNTKYRRGAFDPKAVERWLPVDHYIGGIEHAILHLLYARFITKALRDYAGLSFDEPFIKLSNQGTILGPDGQKMSKSKGNVVDPDEQVASYGADSLRLYLMFMGPYDQGGPYDMGGIAGTRRFIERVWKLVEEFLAAEQAADTSELAAAADSEKETRLIIELHKTIKKVTHDIERLSFNTAIAQLMRFINVVNQLREDGFDFDQGFNAYREALNAYLRLLAPFAPHVAEELWYELGGDKSVHTAGWPVWDEKLVKDELITIVVQVNGKVRADLLVPADLDMDEIARRAQEDELVAKWVEGKEIKRVVKVPGRLINFVV